MEHLPQGPMDLLSAPRLCAVLYSFPLIAVRTRPMHFSALPRSVAVSLLGASVALPAGSQAGAHSPSQPKFEVASIHQNTNRQVHWRMGNTPDGFSAENTSLGVIVRSAFGNNPLQQWDAEPGWLETTRFDVDAKFDVAAFPRPTREQRQAMLQALLAERFHLRIHHESRNFPVLALILATGRPKFAESSPEEIRHNPVDGEPMCSFLDSRRGYAKMQGCTMGDLARRLNTPWDVNLGRIVIDQTGLTGRYDLELRWMPESPTTTPPATLPRAGSGDAIPDANGDLPDLTTALWEQLGIKLKSTKGPLDVIVIDHVEKPSPN